MRSKKILYVLAFFACFGLSCMISCSKSQQKSKKKDSSSETNKSSSSKEDSENKTDSSSKKSSPEGKEGAEKGSTKRPPTEEERAMYEQAKQLHDQAKKAAKADNYDECKKKAREAVGILNTLSSKNANYSGLDELREECMSLSKGRD
jgi:flagellum-specific peptidoglycan hydrolase FlgJ